MKRIFVSSRTGDDAWSGRVAEPNAARTDGPLRTLAAAQTAVRHVKRDLAAAEEIEVVLCGGRYTLDRTWELGAADSGFGRADNTRAQTWPVVWRGAEGERVVISGGVRLDGWQEAELNGRRVWRADVPWLNDARFFRQLWIHDQRRPRARLPKRGVFKVTQAPDARYVGGYGETTRRGSTRFGFQPGDLHAEWTNIGAIDVQFRGLWMSPRAGLVQVDETADEARLDRDTTLRLAYAPDDGLDYIVENVIESLSEPGEWCLDPALRCVWYMPLPGERRDTVDAVAGGIERLLELRGARWLRFENIVFAHAEWRPAPTEAVSEQSSVTAPGAVFAGKGCEGVTFEGCSIQQVGGYGLECDDGATDVVFRNGAIRDLGAGGVKIWHGCRRCVLDASEIADGGHLWMSGAGVVIGKANGNAVTRCHIHDFYYTAISVGWTWGYAESEAYGNVIEWNHIHDIGKGLLSDMGGVYLLGNARGTRVRHNRIHDIRSLRYGGWAIYPDEGSSDLLIENNLCYNTDREIFHQHYGRNNHVRNNIFAYGGDAVLAYTRMEEHVGLTFERNVFLARGTPIVNRVDDINWRSDKTRFDRNLYWREDDAVRFEGSARTLATQPFAHGYAAEAPNFLPLPASGATVRVFHAAGDAGTMVHDAGVLRFEIDGRALTVTGRFAGSAGRRDPEAPPWNRARMEIFLKPFTAHPAMVQFGVAADGACASVAHGCAELQGLPWKAQAEILDQEWSVTLRVPLDALAARIRNSAGVSEETPIGWRFLAGVTLAAAALDFAAWQRHSGDTAGVAADPLFVDPRRGDFRLRPGSPALALGFVPFACPE